MTGDGSVRRTWWAQHAWLPSGVTDGVRLVVADGRFAEIAVTPHPAADDTVLRGLTLPGLANAHSHAFHRALRGRTHGAGGTFWTWRQGMYAVASRLDPDSLYRLARAAYAEMVLVGYTVVGEFHYLHHGASGTPYDDPNAMGAALIAAARDAGIRLTLLDTLYLAGGLGADGHLPLDPLQRRFSDGSAERWAARVGELGGQGDLGGLGGQGDQSRSRLGPLVHLGAAVHSVRAVPRISLRRMAALTQQLQVAVVHAHVSEQPAENAAAVAHYGRTPVGLLDEAGLLGPTLTAVHATHLTSDDIRRLGSSSTAVCLCPTTERDLADGLGPALALHRAGSPLCLGSDQHAVVDPFEEIRAVEMHERLASGKRGRFTPDGLVAMATEGGYAALGWDGGRLAVGGAADITTVSLHSLRTSGSLPGQSMYAAAGADVTDVIVAGRPVVTGGRHLLGAPDEVATLLDDAIRPLWDTPSEARR